MKDGLYIPESMKAEQMKFSEKSSQLNHNKQANLSPDRWESVAEWEERTGKKYPDDGPVWIYDDDHERYPWHLYELWEYKYFDPAPCFVPRIGYGKPPEVGA